MPARSEERTNARKEEIINACEMLYQTMNFKDITIKEIGNVTSFSRTSIYNYFETKEEIFLALLKREYDAWILDLHKIVEEHESMDDEQIASAIAKSLDQRHQLLKILSVNHYDLEEISKKLATIDTDAPVELDREKAALSNFYTPKAYEMFKRLEFKNLLGRFEETNAEPEDAVFLRTVTDFSEAEELFETIAEEEKAGAALLTEETPKDGPMADRSRSLVGMAVAYGSGEPDVVYFPAEGFLTGDYLKEKLTELQKQIPVFCVMDGKEFLKDMPDADEAHLFDAGIAAYLLNPLKSQYSYDDIVKEYVHRYVPAMEEIFGGSKIPAAGKMTPEQQESYAGYQAYAVFAAQENMEKLLKEQGMWDLYRNVEIPLVFTLRQMEADGIAAEKEALSVYGAELAERIRELEAQIYEETGEEFNINSPKQLGVILF